MSSAENPLPMAHGTSTSLTDAPGGGAPGQAADLLHVLLVDRDPEVLGLLVTVLAESSGVVSPVATGEEALDALADRLVDLVVADINLPGLGGLDLLRAVKARQPWVPVVLTTAEPSVESAVLGLRHGAYDYLSKPLSESALEPVIQRVRRERQQGRGRGAHPAGVVDDLGRRQVGMEGLFRIGELALQGVDTLHILDAVLDHVGRSLRADGAVILVRDPEGHFTQHERGDRASVEELLRLLQASFDELVGRGGLDACALTGRHMAALAVVIPGTGTTSRILGVGRHARAGAFLPDEKELLFSYAQTSALALEKIFLRESLESHLVETISSFVAAVESKDRYLRGHSARVSVYAGEIAIRMGLSPPEVFVTRRAGLLHDIGKLTIPDAILQKPGPLTDQEYALVRRHPLSADAIMASLRFLTPESKAVRHHLERYDGQGHPDGLRGKDIPLPARIIAVADAFDAMTSDRAYRAARPLDVARAEVLRNVGTQFDPAAVEAFAAIPPTRLAKISRVSPRPDEAGYAGPTLTVGEPPASARTVVSAASPAPRPGTSTQTCPECGMVLEFELPRFPTPPARLEVEVIHGGRSPDQHYGEIQAFTASGRALLGHRVRGARPGS